MYSTSIATAVVFRKWRDTGTVIALFPELPSDLYGNFCDSYETIGQHGGADYHGVMAQTSPASPSEYESLAIELERIDYNLRPVRRASQAMHDRRREEARAYRLATASLERP